MRYVIAIVACLAIVIIFNIIGTAAFDWKYGGGAMPQLFLFVIVFCTFLSITKKKDSGYNRRSGVPSERFCADTKEKQGLAGVGGWLLWLVAGMMVLGPLLEAGCINANIMMAERQYPTIISLDEWGTFKSTTWWVFLSVAAISFYGGWGLAQSNDWSVVKRAKAILWITGPAALLVLEVLIPIMSFGESNSVDAQFVGSFIGSVIFATIWTAYLSKSKRVRNTYVADNLSYSIVKEEEIMPLPDNIDADSKLNPKNDFAYDQGLYKKAWDEIEKGNVDVGLWAKSFVDSDGDENKAKVAYIKKRIIVLQYQKNNVEVADSVIKTKQQGNASPMHKLSTSKHDSFSERLQQIERRTSARIRNVYNPKSKDVSDKK